MSRPVDIEITDEVIAMDMTLRDHFAGLFMQAYMSSVEQTVGWNAPEHMASYAYKMADAMLRAREAK